jgi:hypothetical protein
MNTFMAMEVEKFFHCSIVDSSLGLNNNRPPPPPRAIPTMIVEPSTFNIDRVPNLQNNPVGSNIQNRQVPLPQVILPTSQIQIDPTGLPSSSARRIIVEAAAARQTVRRR